MQFDCNLVTGRIRLQIPQNSSTEEKVANFFCWLPHSSPSLSFKRKQTPVYSATSLRFSYHKVQELFNWFYTLQQTNKFLPFQQAYDLISKNCYSPLVQRADPWGNFKFGAITNTHKYNADRLAVWICTYSPVYNTSNIRSFRISL